MFMRGFPFYGPWGWVGLVANIIIFALIVIGLVLLILALVRRGGSTQQMVSQSGGTQAPAAASPRDIAQARYARGEITRDEYMQILQDLGK